MTTDFVWLAAGIEPDLPACLWGALVWLKWNQHVESYADARVRIEDYATPEVRSRHWAAPFPFANALAVSVT